MSQVAMKKALPAYEQCREEALGALLPLYQKDELDTSGRAVFLKHLSHCRYCLALFMLDASRELSSDSLLPQAQPAMGARDWLPVPIVVAALLLLCLNFPSNGESSQYYQAKVGVISAGRR